LMILFVFWVLFLFLYVVLDAVCLTL
jgi:hypothetical protein